MVVAIIVTFIFLFFAYNVVIFGKYVEQEPKAMERTSFEAKLEPLVGKFRTVMFVHLFTIAEFCFHLQV